MKKWFLDFSIAESPLCCETYYDKKMQKRMVILDHSGEVIERPLVDLYDTEMECIEAGFEELKTLKSVNDSWPAGTDFRKMWEERYSRLMFHKRRLQLEELGL